MLGDKYSDRTSENVLVAEQSTPAGAAGETIAVPVNPLLQAFRQHLDYLKQLAALLGPEMLADYADEVTSLARTVRGGSDDNAEMDASGLQVYSRYMPPDARPELQALIHTVQQNPDSIRRMSNLPEVVLLAAVERMGTAIRHIQNPSEAVQLAAVKRNPWAVKRIKNPTEAVIACAIEAAPELKRYFDRKLARQKVLSFDNDDQSAE